MVISKIFLDTNIILDILIKDRKNHKYHTALLKKLLDFEVIISEDMISTIYYISKDKSKAIKFLQTIQDKWHITPFGEDVIKKSLEYSLKFNSDLEDTLQCFCAKENGCDLFLTQDKKFIECGVDMVKYEEFLKDV